ncbi:uncharacterized protein EAF02_004168 [Botrytis sinoallii]|uniref:uncharacterized protein n=1 Tax=Botrytis sinoallii TaxID=1463999 RepID=UPI001900F984|nr:uncharacterized protein EAF02_004168 [Botrytis sinoallii]KAF7885659.1 hypothetical protein EAF02_004168 [Botrytis sinoallii]
MRKGRLAKWEANTGDHDMEKGAHCRNFGNINQNPESEPINGLGVKAQRASETTGKDTSIADENMHSLGNQRTVNAGESLKPDEMTSDECLINGYLPLGISERIPSIQLNHLLDLKQKQANISEAESAHRQATESLELTRFAQVQADQSSQQGKTLMIFTVVTILFLPLSFVAAFFAIEMDKFPLDHNGKLPMSYVLKYMLGTSFAVSVPLILLAFNHGRVSRWLATYTTRVANP